MNQPGMGVSLALLHRMRYSGRVSASQPDWRDELRFFADELRAIADCTAVDAAKTLAKYASRTSEQSAEGRLAWIRAGAAEDVVASFGGPLKYGALEQARAALGTSRAALYRLLNGQPSRVKPSPKV